LYAHSLRLPRNPRAVNPRGLDVPTADVWKDVSNLMMQLANSAAKSLWSLCPCTVDHFSLRVWMLAKVTKIAEILAYTKQEIVVAAQEVTIPALDVIFWHKGKLAIHCFNCLLSFFIYAESGAKEFFAPDRGQRTEGGRQKAEGCKNNAL